jgi:hypothetical protein
MKSASTIILGLFCLAISTACKCEPADEEETSESVNSPTQSDNKRKSSGSSENDSVLLKH